MLDIIIKKGKIIDGTGKDEYLSDIGVKDGKIEKIGNLEGTEATKVIDAKGKAVTPGFIDMHSHGDITCLIYPRMESKIMQGITTIVAGNCGNSIAPIDKYWLMNYFELNILDEIEPWVYIPGFIFPVEQIKGKLKERYNLDIDWRTFGEFLNKVEKTGISANYVPLVGHGQIRTQVMGKDCIRYATDKEIAEMKGYVKEAMESGAYGVSVGLDYLPGIFANFAELLALAGEAKKYDGMYAAHWRKTGLRFGGNNKKQKKIDGIIETLEIGKQLDMQVQISHLSTGFDVYPTGNDHIMRAVAQATLQVIDGYLKKGVKAAFDVIPNIVGGIAISPKLAENLLPWLKQSGSLKQFAGNLKAKDYQMQVMEIINAGKWYGINPVAWPEWDESMKVTRSTNSKYIGKWISELAKIKNKSSLETVFDLLIEDPDIQVYSVTQNIHFESVKEFLRHPQATICTDTFAFDLKGTWDSVFMPGPNTYCAMIKYVKELGMDRIEDTIRKATGKAAEILGFSDRGLIQEGYKADILVMDIDNLKTNENYIAPRVFPEGIQYVLVNGEIVVDQGKHTGKLAGKVIRKHN